MLSEMQKRQRRRRIVEWVIAVTVSLTVQAMLFVSLVYRPIDLGVHGAGAVDISLMKLDGSAFSKPAETVDAPIESAPSSKDTDAVQPPASPDVGVAVGTTGAVTDAPAGQPDVSLLPVAKIDPAAEEARMASVAVLVAQAAESEPGQAGESCKVAEWLTQALRNSQEIAAAVALVPRQSRSVANALMLWNGVWVEPPPAAEAGMTSLKYAVLAGVRTAPPACLEQPLRGPLLIPVGDDRDTLLLAIGSGEWRWGDLLTEAYPLEVMTPQS